MILRPSGGLIFHIIVDDFNRTFSIDGPEGPSGVRLHYEMQQVIRQQNKKLRDFDLRAESFDAALAELKTHLPDYTFLGTWLEASRKIIGGRT
jgi:hypothetical protein